MSSDIVYRLWLTACRKLRLKFGTRSLIRRSAPVDYLQLTPPDQGGFGSRQIKAVNIKHQIGIRPLMKEQFVAFRRPHYGKEDRCAPAGGQKAALSGEQLLST